MGKMSARVERWNDSKQTDPASDVPELAVREQKQARKTDLQVFLVDEKRIATLVHSDN
jgi:hypothetical protein